jgi:F-type H+-transporting ATPase subunit b
MIDLDLMLILSVAAIFLLLLVALNVMMFKPITLHLDGRKKTIEDGLTNVNQNSQEIKDFELKAEAILRSAKQKANEIREIATQNAKEAAEKELEAKRVANEQEMQGFYAELEDEQTSLKNSLLGQAPLFKESLKAKFVLTTNQ